MNALGFAILMVSLVLVLAGSRHLAFVGMMIGVLYQTQSQGFTVGGLNIFAFRMVELAAFIRVVSRGEFSMSRLTSIDKALVLLMVYTVLIYSCRTSVGLANRIGVAVDALLSYFAFRGLIANFADVRRYLFTMLWLLVPYAAFAMYESLRFKNVFAVIGGRVGDGSLMRGGRLRAMVCLRHPSLLGTVGATFFPLYTAMFFHAEYRKRAALGLVACVVIVLASNSGSPLSCLMVAACGWMLWRLRWNMKILRWLSLILFVALILTMKAPIWYVVARVSSVTGGDGFHRAKLMDQAFQSLGQWWLLGMPIEATQNWFAYYIHAIGGADITNQFVAYGLQGGIGALLLFVLLLARSFGGVGRALGAYRDPEMSSRANAHLVWGLGVMMMVHVFNLIGITYFDQSYALWYAQLAFVAQAVESHREQAPELNGPEDLQAELDEDASSQYSAV